MEHRGELTLCRFAHAAPAAARFSLPGGCICYPEDRVQALCVQHILRATPLGGMALIEVLDRDLFALVANRYGPP